LYSHLVLTYAGGGDVLMRLEDAPSGMLPEPTARLVLAQVALALAYLHGERIVYRDVKPENTLVGVDGHILLADFGVSKRLATLCGGGSDDSTRVNAAAGQAKLAGANLALDGCLAEPIATIGNDADTRPSSPSSPSYAPSGGGAASNSSLNGSRTRTLVGTPYYMAPEVLHGDGHSFASDWWSAGVLLCELLTGSVPFKEPQQHLQRLQHLVSSHEATSTDDLAAENNGNVAPPLSLAMTLSTSLSEDARALLVDLLTICEAERCGARRLERTPPVEGAEFARAELAQLQSHHFFATLDWAAIERKQVEPPFPT